MGWHVPGRGAVQGDGMGESKTALDRWWRRLAERHGNEGDRVVVMTGEAATSDAHPPAAHLCVCVCVLGLLQGPTAAQGHHPPSQSPPQSLTTNINQSTPPHHQYGHHHHQHHHSHHNYTPPLPLTISTMQTTIKHPPPPSFSQLPHTTTL